MASERGGARKGAGRKPLSTELRTAQLARQALIKKFGSLQKALEYCLGSMEPTLIKFVFEHAFGKSPDKVQQDGKMTITIKRGSRSTIE